MVVLIVELFCLIIAIVGIFRNGIQIGDIPSYVIGAIISLVIITITWIAYKSAATYVFASDGMKFGFSYNDELVIEGYYVDIERIDLQSGMMGYQSEVKGVDSTGDATPPPYILSHRNDCVIKMKNAKPIPLPAGFKKIWWHFIAEYKKCV